MTLLPTLFAAILIASLLTVQQVRLHSISITTSRMSNYYKEQLALSTLHELARADIARGILDWRKEESTIALDNTIYTRTLNNQTWEISYQDVSGLIDIYAISPNTVSHLGLDTEVFAQKRTALLDKWSGGNRPPTLAQSMASLAIPFELSSLLTQSSGAAQINPNTAPLALEDLIRAFPDLASRPKQPEKVRVTIRKVQSQ